MGEGGLGGYGDARTWEATVYSFRGDSFFSVVETKGGFGEGVGMGFFMGEWYQGRGVSAMGGWQWGCGREEGMGPRIREDDGSGRGDPEPPLRVSHRTIRRRATTGVGPTEKGLSVGGVGKMGSRLRLHRG